MALDPVTAVVEGVTTIVNKIWPDASEEQKNALQSELANLAAETDLAKGQQDINKAEATNDSRFVAGWRPFVGWVCGFGLLYAVILEPVSRFIAQVIFKYAGAFPVIDTTITMQLLFALLGVGGLRTVEKMGSKGHLPWQQ